MQNFDISKVVLQSQQKIEQPQIYQINITCQNFDMKTIEASEIPDLIEKHLPIYKKEEIKCEPLLGMTNFTQKISAPGLPPLIFRLFGEGFNREEQNKVVQELAKINVAPKTYYECLDYRIEQFIEGQHPSCQSIFETKNGLLKKIVEKISEFHSVVLPESIPRFNVLETLFEKEKIQAITKQKSENADEFKNLKDKFLKKYQNMKEVYLSMPSQSKSRLVFSHNDLNNLNMFVCTNGEIKFLDFQYSSFCHPAYDIANFLNEFCFEYIEEKPGFRVYRHLSIQDIQKASELYPGKYANMEEDVLRMLILCNWRWGIWSLNVCRTDSSPSFEPLKHGEARFELMEHYHNLLMSLKKKTN